MVGQYHNRKHIQGTKIQYIGSSRQHGFGEDENKGYTLVDTEGNTHFVKNEANMRYVTLDYEFDTSVDDIRPEVDKYIENATIMVADEARDSIKDYIFEIKYLVMTGGTSEAWFERFNSRLEKAPVTILRGNATTNLAAFYANARGYYMNRYKKLGGRA